MEKGNVRWFDNKKGYGFIEKASDGKDLFVHYSAITMEGYKTLRAKEEVEFEVVDGDNGQQAENVVRIAVEGKRPAEEPKEEPTTEETPVEEEVKE
jgi:CspA family cold shock protein